MFDSLDRAVIPLAKCPNCRAETILYGSVDPVTGGLLRRCTACDRPVFEGGAVVYEFFAAKDLPLAGYTVTPPLPTEGGCSGGCSTGGCATCDHVDTCTKH